MNVPVWVWFLTIGLTGAFLLVDVLIIGRRPHVPTMAETGRLLALYVTLAIAFGLGVWHFSGPDFATQYFAGWVTEYSLSIDNLFVFIIIMGKFGVPEKLQQSALLIGIMIALILRGMFIGLGAAAINEFSWIFYIFGAFLIYTAVKLAGQGGSEDDEYEENRVLKWVEKRFPATDQWQGTALFVRSNGSRMITPMFIVIIALGTTDLLFALDSIPAIFGLTQQPFLVLTANIFALMGLRQLYFLIGGLLKRLVYLGIGLAVLLGFIGVKLILHAAHVNMVAFINSGHPVPHAPDISIGQSLAVIIAILAITTVASLLKSGKDKPAPPAG
jgi:tellurite resistance protein TerC